METSKVTVLAVWMVLMLGDTRSGAAQIPDAPNKSQSYEEQLRQLEQKTLADAKRIGQNKTEDQPTAPLAQPAHMPSAPVAPAAQQESRSSALNPPDALDEDKVGIAAKFMTIHPGWFTMGSPLQEDFRNYDEPEHIVELKGFEMQVTELTQLQYFMVMGRNPSHFKKEADCDHPGNFRMMNGIGLCAHHPVENVSWEDAQELIQRLNTLQNQYTYRLPTEEEWEYAARARTSYAYPFIDLRYTHTRESSIREMNNHTWYQDNSQGRTHLVATKRPNPWDLYDMHGNVGELVQDYYSEYPKNKLRIWKTKRNPTAGSAGRVHRGGSWDDSTRFLRSACRGKIFPTDRNRRLGFRLVRERR